jgi:hypothetical protein
MRTTTGSVLHLVLLLELGCARRVLRHMLTWLTLVLLASQLLALL